MKNEDFELHTKGASQEDVGNEGTTANAGTTANGGTTAYAGSANEGTSGARIGSPSTSWFSTFKSIGKKVAKSISKAVEKADDPIYQEGGDASLFSGSGNEAEDSFFVKPHDDENTGMGLGA